MGKGGRKVVPFARPMNPTEERRAAERAAALAAGPKVQVKCRMSARMRKSLRIKAAEADMNIGRFIREALRAKGVEADPSDLADDGDE